MAPVDTAQRIMAGEDRVVCYEGASQYTLGGISACGLASLNFARVLFAKENEGIKDNELIGAMTVKRNLEAIISICQYWSSTLHVEVETILKAPLFHQTLKLESCHYGVPSIEEFNNLLSYLGQTCRSVNRSAVAVITRPPEIIACGRTPGGTYMVFDSHSRPEHPKGAGLFFTVSAEQASHYLYDILQVDSSIFSDPGFQWQAQLLANFSAHILVSADPTSCDISALTDSLLQSSIEVLTLRAKLADLEAQNQIISENTERVEAEMEDLQDENRRLQREANRHRSASKNSEWQLVTPPHSKSASRPTKVDKLKGKGRADIDLQMAWQLQHDFDSERAALEKQRRVLSTSAQAVFDCTICLETLPQDDATDIPGCSHTTCRGCLRQHLLTMLRDHRYPIFCPACGEHADKAKAEITQDVVFDIGVPEKEYIIYEELQLSSISTLLHCRGCKGSVFVDRTEYHESKILSCPLPGCTHAWCKSCQQTIPMGGPPHSCDGSKELDHLMSQEGWKYCPGCKTPIMKEHGCNHMTCMSPGCNTHFCYVCGGNIVRSALRREIQNAVSNHYRRCSLFEVPPEIRRR